MLRAGTDCLKHSITFAVICVSHSPSHILNMKYHFLCNLFDKCIRLLSGLHMQILYVLENTGKVNRIIVSISRTNFVSNKSNKCNFRVSAAGSSLRIIFKERHQIYIEILLYYLVKLQINKPNWHMK